MKAVVQSLRNRNAHLRIVVAVGIGLVVARIAVLSADCGRADDANLGVRIRGPGGSSGNACLSLVQAKSQVC